MLWSMVNVLLEHILLWMMPLYGGSAERPFCILQQNSFNLTIPILQHLRKLVPRLEVLLSITSSLCTDFMCQSWVIRTLQRLSSCYNGFKRSRDEETRYCRPEAACNFGCSETWNNWRFESGESLREVMASYNIGSPTVYNIKKRKHQLRLLIAKC